VRTVHKQPLPMAPTEGQRTAEPSGSSSSSSKRSSSSTLPLPKRQNLPRS